MVRNGTSDFGSAFLVSVSAAAFAGGSGVAVGLVSRATAAGLVSAGPVSAGLVSVGAGVAVLGAIGSYATGRGTFRWLVTAAGLLAISGVTR